MLKFLSLGPITIPSYPFLGLLGLWAGMWLAAREARRLTVPEDYLYDLGLYGFFVAIIGGRAWYILTNWEAYAPNVWQAFAPTANAIAIPEAIIFTLLFSLAYCQKKGLSIVTVTEAIAPGIAIALVITGIGAFLGSERLGIPTTLPWGINQYNLIRHPAHLYQTLANLLIFFIIWRVRLNPPWSGFTLSLLIVLYAGSRLLLEPFFSLPITIGNGLRAIQVAALLVMVVTLAVMAYFDRNKQLVHNNF